MNAYRYVAILTKDRVTEGKVTFTSKRHFEPVALDSMAVVGYIVAASPVMAEAGATNRLKGMYPQELGYDRHERMRVELCEETIIETPQ